MAVFEKLSVDAVKKLLKIDYEYYRNNHDDLIAFDNSKLLEHYADYGYAEGRIPSPLALRENFFNTFEESTYLEIGPFFTPIMRGKNIKYVDVLSQKQLKKRAKDLKVSQDIIDSITKIDFVTKDGTLGLINEKFDTVISSHNLEHQVNLISHLNEVSRLLKLGGSYKMVVPDCAFCFDATIKPSMISEVISKSLNQDKIHSLEKVIEHRALTDHNDSALHWEDSLKGFKPYNLIDVSRVSFAIKEFKEANGEYIDVHSWQFRPHTLSDILQSLIELKLIEFSSVSCYGSVYGRCEFCIELFK